MNRIKINYKVDQNKNVNMEKSLESFLFKTIEDNKQMENLKLVSISIRVSHFKPNSNKLTYTTLLNTAVEYVNTNITDLMSELLNKINKKRITFDSISSFHIHL